MVKRTTSVEGVEELVVTLEEFKTVVLTAVDAGVNMTLERIRTAAITRAPKYVGKPDPRIIPGLLRASAFVHYMDHTQDRPAGFVGFGVVYARRQHYEVAWHHQVGEALYLRHATEYVFPLCPLFVSLSIKAALANAGKA
jgi:hypothetical protein